ncbi:2-amino-4-hydroxy-6-hydroxymethyldihydropteridine diphosphokinase [Mucilaginibacter paludis]|uniref:2-amino-4-hydroxy-6-hydroxymethyldihydropteridine pyrophosphokinase n=1 Tax=Mucilaginibacter paludis DSM 18603 TaxID=714943 RepID=H1YB23_9SPHI|nr:2-amino-4-hydroxy-6-hydroxymethyldihydropteridine diphosphokinase [Mucilaginibacter paludis]EHQ30056.1 2-amino-4-hydroxy-6-hydroxymethyldihydropteridin epyrophosphokinase [Mucilaginibacter paludis DSM 18603]
MIKVFLLLGSNMGNRQLFLENAISQIETLVGPVIRQSAVHQTLAWGKTDEPDYLNQVLLVETAMPARQLLQTILGIEKQLGRERKEKWGSRTIDIDILFYGNEVINEPDLVVPHPQLHNRKFTLAPLAEIAPGYIHPVLLQSIAQLNEAMA